MLAERLSQALRQLDLKATRQPFSRSLAGKSRSLSELSEKNESDLLYAGASTPPPPKGQDADYRSPVWYRV